MSSTDPSVSRRGQRQELLKVLYAREVGGSYTPERMSDFQEEIVEGVQQHQSDLDEALSEHLTDWRIDRVHPIERVLLRMGAYEIFHTSINKAIVINEAVELAKQYGHDSTASFVNGILDNLDAPEQSDRE